MKILFLLGYKGIFEKYIKWIYVFLLVLILCISDIKWFRNLERAW